MIGIYKITNRINGKIYIGQSINIKFRWKQHEQEAKGERRNSLLYQAMRKYGLENFSFEVIEECSQENLNEREVYWIDYYNSFNEGYNMTPGGTEPSKVNIQEIYDLWDAGYTLSDIVERTNVGKTSVNKYLNEYENYSAQESNRRGGKKARETAIKNGKVITPQKNIKQYDLWGNYIRNWNTQNEIERKLEIDAETIGRCLKGKAIQAGGFQWIENDKLPQDLTKDNKFRAKFGVDQFSLNGDYLKTYVSIDEAAKEMNCDKRNIARVCRHEKNRMSACGYKWEYNYNYWDNKKLNYNLKAKEFNID